MKTLKFLLLSIFLVLVGCIASPMKLTEGTSTSPPDKGESVIVFLRESAYGAGIPASLYEVKGENIIFIGIISNATKVAYKVAPGKHTFMVVSEAADFMEANLSEGKTYYGIVSGRVGLWKARFSLWPVKKATHHKYSIDSIEFQATFKNTKLAYKTPEADAWYEQHKQSVIQKKRKYWRVWKRKSKEATELHTLTELDGVCHEHC